MQRIHLHLLLAFLSVSAVACVRATNVKPTTEVSQSVRLSNPVLFRTTLAYVEGQSWEVRVSDQGLGYIEAVSKVDSASGMNTRERWMFWTRDGEVSVQLRLEYLENAEWSHVDLVCDSYSYFREHQHLGAIAEKALSSRVASR